MLFRSVGILFAIALTLRFILQGSLLLVVLFSLPSGGDLPTRLVDFAAPFVGTGL